MWDFFRIFASSKPFDTDMEEENTLQMNDAASYNDDSIKHLEDMEHIRLRPGMYIGKLGDGSSHDDGIYVLIKEVIDNAIDEFTSGFGKRIDMTISFAERKVSIRDYGRGIPLLKMVEAVSRLNTGAKYDSKVFQKSVGLNGVGTKAVNALSSWFKVQSFREGKTRYAEFCEGKLVSDSDIVEFHPDNEQEATGTLVEFIPDSTARAIIPRTGCSTCWSTTWRASRSTQSSISRKGTSRRPLRMSMDRTATTTTAL